ncbi:hypothetical protein [Paraprevotella clara]|uniref:hypothetical protein n=1 Tax=Paraprevotella clara TaxID=454154 RepID=UPI003FF0307C
MSNFIFASFNCLVFKKRQPALFKSRWDKFMENTRKGILYGEWNDNGRLLL